MGTHVRAEPQAAGVQSLGRPEEARFFWPGGAVPGTIEATIERLRPIAQSLSLPPPSIEQDALLTQWGMSVPFVPPAQVRVDDPEAAARLCLRLLAEVHGMRADDWLWITDIVQPEDWPSPLPKPARWPPDIEPVPTILAREGEREVAANIGLFSQVFLQYPS